MAVGRLPADPQHSTMHEARAVPAARTVLALGQVRLGDEAAGREGGQARPGKRGHHGQAAGPSAGAAAARTTQNDCATGGAAQPQLHLYARSSCSGSPPTDTLPGTTRLPGSREPSKLKRMPET